jgi:hypothetical protein
VRKDNSILVNGNAMAKYFMYYSNTLALQQDKTMHLTSSDIERIANMPMNFVMGKERSGTTLLQIMLNAHPNIAAPPETRFILLLKPKYGRITEWTEKNIHDFCNDLFVEGLFRIRWKMNKGDLVASLIAVREHLNYTLLCKTIFYLFAPAEKEVKLLFDKNPVYYYFLPELEKLFPSAKFIHLVRDYRANIASHKRVFNLKKASDLAYRWLKVNKLIEGRKARLPDKYITITYESLVTNPEDTMKAICTFLGLPYSDTMSQDQTKFMYPSFKELKGPRFLEVHGSLLEPINESHIDEWKQKLTPDEVMKAEAVAGEYGRKLYGYETVTKVRANIGPLQTVRIKIKYVGIMSLYKILFKNLPLYYFVKRKIWKDF